MKKFEKPFMEIIDLDLTDVISTSVETTPNGNQTVTEPEAPVPSTYETPMM